MAASNRKYILTNQSPAAAFQLAATALQMMGATIREAYPQMGKLSARVSVGMRSWGENLSVMVYSMQGSCQLEVVSECALPTQLVDWGKNAENTFKFEQMYRMLEYNAAQQAAQQQTAAPEGTLICPKCGAPVPAGANFCPMDGTKVR